MNKDIKIDMPFSVVIDYRDKKYLTGLSPGDPEKHVFDFLGKSEIKRWGGEDKRTPFV
jgi:hypothetical protein